MSRSIISNERRCYICGNPFNLHRHHVFYGADRRKTSEREGCWVYLCAFHHNMSNAGVHFDKMADLKLKRECQEIWEDYNKSDHDGFRRVFGVSYV